MNRRSAVASVLAVSLLLLGVLVPRTAEASPPGPPPMGVAGLEVASGLSVILVEGATGQVILARDEGQRRPIASAIKLVTALTVVEHLPAGHLVTIGPEVLGIEGSSYALRPGEVRDVDDLLAGLLLRSGNDAAVALAVAVAGTEEDFVDLMVQRLQALGVDARPGSASGLDASDALTAAELAIVSRAALDEPRIRSMIGVPVLALRDGFTVENRNLFLTDVPGATGLKTGFTSAAGYTLAASAQRDGRELVAIVLGANDDLQRRAVAIRLLDHGFLTTRLDSLERSVTLRTTRGPVRFATVPAQVTVPIDAALTVDWPRSLRPDDEIDEVPLLAQERSSGSVGVARADARRDVGTDGLGAALAEGVYGALRPFALAGGAHTTLR